MDTVVVTGSAGLAGSAISRHFHELGYRVVGVDNFARREFFGREADTCPIASQLQELPNYHHLQFDITKDREGIAIAMQQYEPVAIIHCAAQPAHEFGEVDPRLNFETNVIGTFNMLDLTHRFAPDATFIFLSSSKVYGTAINADLREGPTRYRHELMLAQAGLLESQPVDQTIHTQYGASKLAADLMAQEFGWSYGMNVVVLRCGCITGPHHAGVSQHGFLSHLVKSAVAGKGYKIYGFGGKQVRDQIHAHDLATACEEIVKNPPTLQVFNLGGGPRNSISVIEAIVKLETILNREVPHTFFDEPRYADQVVVVNNIQRFRQAFPVWGMAYNVDMMLREMVEAEQS